MTPGSLLFPIIVTIFAKATLSFNIGLFSNFSLNSLWPPVLCCPGLCYMEISVKKNENQILFELEGSLDIYTSLDLKSSLEENVKENNPDVVIDLDKLTYIDSSGIGILIKALNYIQGLNGKLCVANLKPAIEKVFKVSGLTSYFEILSADEFKSRYSF